MPCSRLSACLSAILHKPQAALYLVRGGRDSGYDTICEAFRSFRLEFTGGQSTLKSWGVKGGTAFECVHSCLMYK